MREIKFRVWDKHSKKMAEVTQIRFSKVQYTLVKYRMTDNKGRKIDDWSYIGADDGSDTVVLMQYTGIKDKNGKEIYEGDIIQTPWGEKRTVFAVPGGFAVEAFDSDLNKYGKGKPIVIEALADLQNSSCIRDCEVIGNIYENKDLLGQR